jgi:polar amino acid transport system permease protein
MASLLGSGLMLTVRIFVITLIGSLPLGIVVALCRMSRFKPLSILAQLYISILRGTPLMLQLMAIMFGPYYLFGMQMGSDWKYWACSIGFILNYAAYFGEIYRSGIQSIPRGQYEAANVLGYSRAQTFMKIVLPQVIKRILPAMGNEIITLVKDTSLAFVLGIGEMFSQAKALSAAQVSMVPYALAALVYWVVCLLIEFVLGRIEKKMNYYRS